MPGPNCLLLVQALVNPLSSWADVGAWLTFCAYSLAAAGGMVAILAFERTRRRWDRERITEQLRSRGWNPLAIRFIWYGIWFFDHRRGRCYRVSYRVKNGAEVTACCETNLFIGVRWINDSPPTYLE